MNNEKKNWLWAGWVASYLQRSLSHRWMGGPDATSGFWKQPFSAVRALGGYPGNELDITIHVIVSQLSGHCDVISNLLWHQQQNENRASVTWGRSARIVLFVIIYGFVMSYKKYINTSMSLHIYVTFQINPGPGAKSTSPVVTVSWL